MNPVTKTDLPPLVTAEEVAQKLAVRASSVKRWAREQRIPSVRITGRVVRFDLAEVLKSVSK